MNYFKRLYGIEKVILRYANVYGPRRGSLCEGSVIEIFICKILKREKPTIFGDGTQSYDFIFVEDVVRANILALNGKEGIYNIGTGRETSLNLLIEIISKALGIKVKPKRDLSREWEVKRIILDVKRAREELGFIPQFSLEEGIRRTIEWYRGG